MPRSSNFAPKVIPYSTVSYCPDRTANVSACSTNTDDDKCLSVQCIYCQQIRAKNTSRQKQHLLECPGLQNHPTAARPQPPADHALPTNGYGPPSSNLHSPNGNLSTSSLQNGTLNTPTPTFPPRPPLSTQQTNGHTATPVPRQTPKIPSAVPKPSPARHTPNSVNGGVVSGAGGSSLPPPPLEDVHQAFVEFRAKEEDKCLSVQCIYCNQIRAKNTSRQRQHLLECPTYLNVMKDAIPANNLIHRFDEGDIARSISLPTPSLELDFRMSIKLNPRISTGSGPFGQRQWLSYTGGQWAGRWGKGIVIPGGQDSQLVVKDLATKIDATYLIQTQDDPPAFITVKTTGWWTGPKDVLERMQDPEVADTVPAGQYKWRVNVDLETGDERYQTLNTSMWVGSGCKRGKEGKSCIVKFDCVSMQLTRPQ